MGNIVTSTTAQSHTGQREPLPQWIQKIHMIQEYTTDKFGAISDGMYEASPNTVVRSRAGQFHTDGARWGRGFTSGKHVFTIVFPEELRGTEASVGVGMESASLHEKGRITLVGDNRYSWGIDLRTRRAVHKKKPMKRYPVTQEALPDIFYMYLNMDSGTLSFASDVGFYGTAFHGLRQCAQPLFPMVSATVEGAAITMTYNGSEMDPVTMQQVYGQQSTTVVVQ
ncbi:hypothetical protein LOTGIDRAFT_159930 [Lottia gigantea]|uniref:B30.2/SPRY domain-containing protein n=1 Tax=Lottia gigantea TaxID=225164 RepID=V4C4N5_LOTGI|nr:hypothetical protein LOTGIDRAFT_159930 [Lottia gigantea]ESO96514.1 hypothetical protein LOTGIDRAFT_159930 [Lottia gigantea]